MAEPTDALKSVIEDVAKKVFSKSFEILVELVRKLQTNTQKAVDDLKDKYDQLHSDLTTSLKSSPVFNEIVRGAEDKALTEVRDIKAKTLDLIETEREKLANDTSVARANLEAKHSKLKSDVQGSLASIASKASKIALDKTLPLIPTIEEVASEIPNLGAEIASSLEALPDDDKLVIEAIRGLRKELDDLRKLSQQRSMFGSGGVGKHNVNVYDLSSSLDGVTKVFSLPAMYKIVSVQSSSFPNAFRPTTDYAHDASANTLTFTSEINATTTLAAGQTVIILYAE